jgi:fused signal recognition particle receptor
MLGFLKKNDLQTANEGWLARLKNGLARTGGRIASLFGGGRIDEALFEGLESVLLAADAGVEASRFLIERLRARTKKENLADAAQLKAVLAEELLALLAPLEKAPAVGAARPWVIMLVGVNGAGKTTSIGKLARHYKEAGLKLLLAAGDTFRAAAREQLMVWGERNGVAVISQQGGDPGAVMFDAVQAARARGVDLVLADTAGRLPTQLNLMEELKKIKRVIAKAEEGAPHEIWLVIDANTGQNAVAQVKAFDDALGLTGLVVTKFDGTAKGGVLAAIARQRPVPLRFIGVGEGLDDLRPFVAQEFVAALLD